MVEALDGVPHVAVPIHACLENPAPLSRENGGMLHMHAEIGLTLTLILGGQAGSVGTNVDLRFQPVGNVPVQKRYDVSWRMSSTSNSTTVTRGEVVTNPADSPQLEGVRAVHIVVSDRYARQPEGSHFSITRHFEEADCAVRVGPTGRIEELAKLPRYNSPFKGDVVQFSWDAKKRATECTALKPDGVDSKSLARLVEEMDYRYLLPEQRSHLGEEWSLDLACLGSLIAPGGNLFPIPESSRRPSASDNPIQIRFDSAWLTIYGPVLFDGAEGKIAGRLIEASSKEHPECAVIDLELRASVNKEVTETLRPLLEANIPQGQPYSYGHQIQLKVMGKGRLFWDTRAGHVHSLMLECQTTMKEAARCQTRVPQREGAPTNTEFTWDAVWEGTLDVETKTLQ